MQDESKSKPLSRPQDVLNVVHFFADAICAWFTPVLRSGIGSHAMYRSTVPAAIGLLMFSGFADCPLIAWYIPVWLVLVAFRRATASRHQHSLYRGTPWLLFFLSEKRARMLEPVMMFGIATFLSQYSAALADFFTLGAIAMGIVFMIDMAMISTFKRRQRDMQIEMESQSRWQREG